MNEELEVEESGAEEENHLEEARLREDDMKNMPIPMFRNVILRAERDVRSAGGLAIPDSAVSNCAIVVAVGPGMWDSGIFVETTVKVGQRVLLDAPQGTVGKFHWGGTLYRMVDERFIAAILPGDNPLGDRSPSLISLS